MHLEEDRGGIAGHLAELPNADVADALNDLSVAETGEVLKLLPEPLAAAVCNQPTFRRRGPIFEQLEPELAARTATTRGRRWSATRVQARSSVGRAASSAARRNSRRRSAGAASRTAYSPTSGKYHTGASGHSPSRRRHLTRG
jgi:hypothetical protein